MEELEKARDEPPGEGQVLTLLKEENKRLRAETKVQAEMLASLQKEQWAQSQARVDKLLGPAAKPQPAKGLEQCAESLQAIERTLEMANGRLEKVEASRGLRERLEQVLGENEELRAQLGVEVPRLEKKVGELRAQKGFLESELSQAKSALITHIAALNSQRGAGGGSAEAAHRLEQENLQLLQAKAQVENMCKQEIAALLGRVAQLGAARDEARRESRAWERRAQELERESEESPAEALAATVEMV